MKKITKKEFAHVARKAMYEEIDKLAEEHEEVDDSMEGIITVTACKFIGDAKKKLFGENKEAEIEKEDFAEKMADISSGAIADGMKHDFAKGPDMGLVSLLSGILCSAVNGNISANMHIQIFGEEED